MIYFYIYCVIGMVFLFIARYFLSSEQKTRDDAAIAEAQADAEKQLPVPALAAVYVLTYATTIILWPIYVVRDLSRGETP